MNNGSWAVRLGRHAKLPSADARGAAGSAAVLQACLCRRLAPDMLALWPILCAGDGGGCEAARVVSQAPCPQAGGQAGSRLAHSQPRLQPLLVVVYPICVSGTVAENYSG